MVLALPTSRVNAAGQCYCHSDFGPTPADAVCSSPAQADCTPDKAGGGFKECLWQSSAPDCDKAVIKWRADNNTFLGAQANQTQQQTQAQAGKGLIYQALQIGTGKGADCLFQDKWDPNGPCADVSVFVTTLVNLGAALFTVIGGLALVMFIYGGFILILSQGNPEKVKQGTGVMAAAVIGLVVAFGGYVLIKFLGEAVALKSYYKLQ